MSIRIGSNEANEGKMKMETAVATATATTTTSEATGEAEVSSTISSDDEIAGGEGHSGLKYEKIKCNLGKPHSVWPILDGVLKMDFLVKFTKKNTSHTLQK